MKTLTFMNEEYQAERIVKTNTDIIGYNGNSEVFSFKGISDFSYFQLAEGEEWDMPDNVEGYLIDLDFRLSMIELGL